MIRSDLESCAYKMWKYNKIGNIKNLIFGDIWLGKCLFSIPIGHTLYELFMDG